MIDYVKQAVRLLAYLIIIEVILGGAGRYFVIGNLSIRMILYGITFFLLLICILFDNKNIKNSMKSMDINIKLIIIFLIWVIFSALNGFYFSKNNVSQIAMDLTGFASFALIILFAYIFNNKRDIDLTAKIISVSVVIQACAIVLIHYSLGFGILEVNSLDLLFQRLYLGNIGLIQPNTIRIFLKSALFLQIGFLFLLGMVIREIPRKKKILLYIALVIVTYALILTFTRGFWIATFVTTFIYIILKKPKKFIKPFIIVLCGIIFMLGISILSYKNANIIYSIASRAGIISIKQNVATNKIETVNKEDVQDLSLDYRQKLKQAMFKKIKEKPILGSGFGILLKEIKQETSHCEYTFYDIWMEMGLIGLFIYVSMFIILFIKWRKIRKRKIGSNELNFADEYFIGLLGVIIASSLNPFLNNPIGITFLIIVISSINIYLKE